jgi:hypothetical protein
MSRTRKPSALRPLPSAALATGAGVGAPASYVLVWLLSTYVLPAPMPPDIAAAAGSVIAVLVGHLYERFVRRGGGAESGGGDS